MASSGSAPEGANTGSSGSPVRRAAALAVLTEEPAEGLFPASAPGTATASVAAAVATAGAAATAGASTRSDAGKETPAPEQNAPGKAPRAAAAGNGAPESGTTAPDAATTDPMTEKETAEPKEDPAGTAAEGRAGTAAEGRAEADTAAEARLATAGRPATVSRRAVGLPLGRPGKPMIAAAVVGGLVLIGVPFLISGPDDKPGPTAADAPAGSPMGPDGTGPGLVPGEQRAPDSGSLKDGHKPAAHVGGASDPTKSGTTPTGGIHEGGNVEAKGSAASHAAPGTAATKTADRTTSASNSAGAGKTTTSKSGSGNTVASGSGTGTTQKTTATSTVVYTGITGRGCATPSGGGYQRDNFYTDGSNGWYARSSGGWTGDGCNGSYDSVPMSGDTNTDMQSRVKWWWNPGTKARTCQISVYIPNIGSTLYVGGHPTTYHVLVNANDRTTKYDSFTINQVNHRGQWVNAGTFAMKGSTIGVKLLDRGDDWSKGWEKAHHAAAQMKVTCRS
ncbi:hypothetical protein [Streptomyces sp. NPDC014734]|uniref:hypothetical protein n=1 Tax=Streptomyces sp. NPDC014734 TaxID=3364886 RepID=UPI0037030F85